MKPKPVVVTTICSECGLDWDDHGDNPTTSDCVRLLKIELARRPKPVFTYPYSGYNPYWTWNGGVTISNTAPLLYEQSSNHLNDGHSVTIKTPQSIDSTCTAVVA